MEIPRNEGRHQTTVELPMYMAMEIRTAGLTFASAYRLGWEAYKKVRILERELEETQENLIAARARIEALYKRLSELGVTQ